MKTITERTAGTAKRDPIYAAIAAHRASEKKWMAVASDLDRKESSAWRALGSSGPNTAISWSARKKIGPRPYKSVLWRTYGVDESDIKEKRDLYLEQRCRNQARLDDIWIRRAGVGKLRKRLDRDLAEETIVADRLSRTKPTTLAGVAALIEYASSDFEHSTPMDWQCQALATAAAVLKAKKEPR
jgi:hypothetical protein